MGYAPWNPRGPTLELLEQIDSVLDDHADYWPLTPRQILYRLMGRGQATKADAQDRRPPRPSSPRRPDPLGGDRRWAHRDDDPALLRQPDGVPC